MSTGLLNVPMHTGLLSSVPYSTVGVSNVFGIGSEHPFANYWTCAGGLPEVISVLPDKLQADIVLSRYFECVDPVYPMLHRQTFYADYEHFWSLSKEDKNRVDPSFIALVFVMLALGTQFVTTTPPVERKQSAEFYASASNQSLRLSCYLSTASIRSVQAMVLLTYFLINDNHASDGWAFAGVLTRQAYAMGLHRDPNIGKKLQLWHVWYYFLTRRVSLSHAQRKCFREAATSQVVAGRPSPGYFPDRAATSPPQHDPHRRQCGRLD